MSEKLFELGTVCSTPAALAALKEAGQEPAGLLARHVRGDWGDELCEDDRHANSLSLEQGGRILSAYVLDSRTKVWVITEWDRSVTTILLPSEY